MAISIPPVKMTDAEVAELVPDCLLVLAIRTVSAEATQDDYVLPHEYFASEEGRIAYRNAQERSSTQLTLF